MAGSNSIAGLLGQPSASGMLGGLGGNVSGQGSMPGIPNVYTEHNVQSRPGL